MDLEIGSSETAALEQQWSIKRVGDGVTEAVAEIQRPPPQRLAMVFGPNRQSAVLNSLLEGWQLHQPATMLARTLGTGRRQRGNRMIQNFERAAAGLTEYWSPKVVGEVNDQYVKVAKLKGTLVWHKHDDEDELFYVVRGSMVIEYADSRVTLDAGDFHIVPKGTLHNPIAEEECLIVLIEPKRTKHTGDVVIEKTKSIEQQLA